MSVEGLLQRVTISNCVLFAALIIISVAYFQKIGWETLPVPQPRIIERDGKMSSPSLNQIFSSSNSTQAIEDFVQSPKKEENELQVHKGTTTSHNAQLSMHKQFLNRVVSKTTLLLLLLC